MKTAPNNKKIRELITLVKEGKLIPRPEFQRRLVWAREDKNHFIDTILRGFPFPEIYLADGDVDLATGEGTQLLVDGLQRVNTIVQYFSGDPDLKLTTVPAYITLESKDKQAFLQYDVAVRDLGSVTKEEVIEVFKRLNATKYSLTDIEVSNALYAGALKKFAEAVSGVEFFQKHQVFSAADYKRMGDLRYCLSIICTMLSGYFNRDDVFEELLDRYNDDFPQQVDLQKRLEDVLSFCDECGFDSKSRVWRKADLFTFLIELDYAMNFSKLSLQPSEVVSTLQAFFDSIDTNLGESSLAAAVYYKAALQASNDKINRIRRGFVIGGLLSGKTVDSVGDDLRGYGLA